MAPKIDFNSIEEDFTDEQIKELLQNASRRLKGETVPFHHEKTQQSPRK